MVVGLGTRAVNRTEGDYARVIALDEPLVMPFMEAEDQIHYSQRNIDVLDIANNQMASVTFNELLRAENDEMLLYFAKRDLKSEENMKKIGLPVRQHWVINFEKLLCSTDLSGVMQQMLKILEKVYQYPVDIEFTVNFKGPEKYYINLLQCRPLQAKGINRKVQFPRHIEYKKIFFQVHNTFMGGNIHYYLQRVIYVEPEAYSRLSDVEKYRVARCIGKLNSLTNREELAVLLVGPGRWGTSTPSLGVPVNFSKSAT